jgi:glycyl-tRNA synthetase
MYAMGIGFQSCKDNTFTLRDWDSTAQVRSTDEDITNVMVNMVDGSETGYCEEVAEVLG